MRARDVVEQVPTVTPDDPVLMAVRLMARSGLPGLIVVDERRRPRTVLPGTQVLRLAVPRAHQDDPLLVRTIDESHADMFWQEIGDRTVAECLPSSSPRVAAIGLDATMLELAAAMARLHSPLLAAVDDSGAVVGGITLSRVLAVLVRDDPPA